MNVESFLLGAIVTLSMFAGLFFLKFWRRTRDTLFLAFGCSFVIESFNRMAILFTDQPNEASPAIYLVRLFAFLIILAAILQKNLRRS